MPRELLIKGLISLIADLSQFNSSDDFYNISVGDQEFQFQEVGNMPELYFNSDFPEVGEAIKNVVQYLWRDEQKHFEEEEQPADHIFHSLQVLKQIIPHYQII